MPEQRPGHHRGRRPRTGAVATETAPTAAADTATENGTAERRPPITDADEAMEDLAADGGTNEVVLRRPRRHVAVRRHRRDPRAFDEGGLVTGTVVKIDSDEVLLDIGFKSEGVIPSKELSIRNDVDPHEVVHARRGARSSRPPEGGQGRSADPLEEARAVRARVGHDREDQGRRGRRLRPGHRGRQGWAHPRHRPARLPARVARRPAPRARPAAVRRHARSSARSSSSTRTATTSCSRVVRTSRRPSASSATSSSPT